MPDPRVLAVPYCPRWTSEKPTVPGWYWLRLPDEAEQIRLLPVPPGPQWPIGTLWSGPIPPPEPEG